MRFSEKVHICPHDRFDTGDFLLTSRHHHRKETEHAALFPSFKVVINAYFLLPSISGPTLHP